MCITGNPDTHAKPAAPTQLWLTWAFTQTYRHPVPLDALAAVTDATVNELAADPASLLGVAGDRLADLLTGLQAPDRTLGIPEVEVIETDYDATPTLATLVDAGRAALRAESDHPSGAARALAALLAGLRREGIGQR